MRLGHSRAVPARSNRQQPRGTGSTRKNRTPVQVPALDWPALLYDDNVPLGDLIAEMVAHGQEINAQAMMA